MLKSPVTITESAKRYLVNMADSKNQKYIWFGIKSGGCSGFSYEWKFADTLDSSTTPVELNDSVSLLIDQTSEMYILGSEIDYVQDIAGSYLRVNNPLVASSCGCGESFNPKI